MLDRGRIDRQADDGCHIRVMPDKLVNTLAWRRPPLRGSWSPGAGYFQR